MALQFSDTCIEAQRQPQCSLVAAPNPGLKIESTLGAMENMSTVKLVDWDNEIVGGGMPLQTNTFSLLLGKYGRHLNSDAYTGFQIHTYTDIALERPWTYYDYLEPLTVHYDGGISLHGLAVGQGDRAAVIAAAVQIWGRNRPLWIVYAMAESRPDRISTFATSLRSARNAEGGSGVPAGCCAYELETCVYEQLVGG